MDPGARTPPTEPLKSVSPVNTSSPLITKLSIPAVCPGVCSVSTCRPPTSSVSPGSIVRSTLSIDSASSGCASTSTSPHAAASATWSWWWWVRSSVVTSTPSRCAASWSGAQGPPESTTSAVPPSSSATRKVFDSQSSFMERSMITAPRSLVSGGRGRPAHPVPRAWSGSSTSTPARPGRSRAAATRRRCGRWTSSSRGVAAARPTSRAAWDASTCCARAWPPS